MEDKCPNGCSLCKPPNNPPAFPHINPNYDGNWDKEPQRGGMTLRDYFAASALPSLMSKPNMYASGVVGTNSYEHRLAEDTYKIADAMLKARESK